MAPAGEGPEGRGSGGERWAGNATRVRFFCVRVCVRSVSRTAVGCLVHVTCQYSPCRRGNKPPPDAGSPAGSPAGSGRVWTSADLFHTNPRGFDLFLTFLNGFTYFSYIEAKLIQFQSRFQKIFNVNVTFMNPQTLTTSLEMTFKQKLSDFCLSTKTSNHNFSGDKLNQKQTFYYL